MTNHKGKHFMKSSDKWHHGFLEHVNPGPHLIKHGLNARDIVITVNNLNGDPVVPAYTVINDNTVFVNYSIQVRVFVQRQAVPDWEDPPRVVHDGWWGVYQTELIRQFATEEEAENWVGDVQAIMAMSARTRSGRW